MHFKFTSGRLQSRKHRFGHSSGPGIAFKITMFMSAMVLISVGSIGYWTYHQFHTELVQQELADLQTNAKIAAVRFQSHLQELIHDIELVSKTPPVQGIVQSRTTQSQTGPIEESVWQAHLSSIFHALLTTNTHYLDIRLITAKDAQTIVALNRDPSSGSIGTVQDNSKVISAAFKTLASTQYIEDKVHISPITSNTYPYINESLPVPTISIELAIYDTQQQLFGFLVLVKNLGPLFKLLHESVESGETLYIINETGANLSFPIQTMTSNPHPIPANLFDTYKQLEDTLTPGLAATNTIIRNSNNQEQIAVGLYELNYQASPSTHKIYFLNMASYADVVRASNASRFASVVVSAIVIPLVILIGLLFYRSLTRPLMQMVDAIQNFTLGKYKLNLPVKAKDEVGILARAFDNLFTQIQQRNAYLQESEVRLRTTLETIADGLITIDTQGNIESFNPGAEKIFGYEAVEVIGKNISILIPKPQDADHNQHIANYLKTGESKIIDKTREVKGRRKDQSVFPLELTVSEMHFGKQIMFTGILRDITERKKIEKMKNEFISTVSHELRTPLTSIRGSLGLISSGVTGELSSKTKELVCIAENNSERLVRLINDILDIEKIESGKMRFDYRLQDLLQIVEQSILDNRGYAKQYNVTLVLEPHPTPIVINADADRINQVMTNLLSNAIKYSPKGGSVSVKVLPKDESVQVWISDQGPGIPAEFQKSIFEKFSQADASDTRTKGGTGLGLNIAKAIVEKHKGTIHYTTQLGSGTSFYFDLPRHHVRVSQQPSTISPLYSAENIAILICEDDRDVAKLLEILLNNAGYATQVAYSAGQALQLLAKQPFAAMTLDLVLPDFDGIQLIKKIRAQEKTSNLPIVVVSAIAQEGQARINGHGIAVVDWLDKPIEHHQLMQAVRRAINNTDHGHAEILHVEDDKDVQNVLSNMLSDYATVTPADTLAQARQQLANSNYDLIILDLGLPDGFGLELLPMLNQRQPPIPVIIFSAYELEQEQARLVDQALVKSQTGNQELVTTIRGLLG